MGLLWYHRRHRGGAVSSSSSPPRSFLGRDPAHRLRRGRGGALSSSSLMPASAPDAHAVGAAKEDKTAARGRRQDRESQVLPSGIMDGALGVMIAVAARTPGIRSPLFPPRHAQSNARSEAGRQSASFPTHRAVRAGEPAPPQYTVVGAIRRCPWPANQNPCKQWPTRPHPGERSRRKTLREREALASSPTRRLNLAPTDGGPLSDGLGSAFFLEH